MALFLCARVGELERDRESTSSARVTQLERIYKETVASAYLSQLKVAVQTAADRLGEPFAYPANATVADVKDRIKQLQNWSTGQ